MKIGIVSNSDSFIPAAYALASQQQQVHIFFSASDDLSANARVQHFAAQSRLPFCEDRKKGRDLYEWLDLVKPGICFVIGYPSLIDVQKIPATTPLFNIHFGPIPAFRGPSPVFWQLKKGASKLALCIHRVTEKFDSGEVVWFREVENLPHYTFQSVHDLFNQVVVEGIFQCVGLTLQGIPLPVAQMPVTGSAYYKRPGLAEVIIDWQTMTATEICNLVRACNPWNKGAISLLNQQEVKLLDATIEEGLSRPEVLPGTIIEIKESLKIATLDRKVIRVNMLFLYNCYIAAYASEQWGINKGLAFQQLR